MPIVTFPTQALTRITPMKAVIPKPNYRYPAVQFFVLFVGLLLQLKKENGFSIQELVKRRKLSFEAKEREIEAALLMEEEKEKQWLDEDEDDKLEGTVKSSKIVTNTDHKETGEIQQEKIKAAHGKLLLSMLLLKDKNRIGCGTTCCGEDPLVISSFTPRRTYQQ